MPLRAGLGLITEDELKEWSDRHCKKCGLMMVSQRYRMAHFPDSPACECKNPESLMELCPKIYTTRKSPLKGEYYVVEGSRFKAKPVEPRIEFKVEQSWELDLGLEAIKFGKTMANHTLLQKKEIDDFVIRKLVESFNTLEGHSFPELDLGYKTATFEGLKNVLLNCNKGTTIDTPFYVNRLEPINSDRGQGDILQEGEKVSSLPPVTSPSGVVA